jgi:hypothetical protein
MPPDIITSIALSSVLAVAVSVPTLYLKSVRRIVMLPLFIVIVSLLTTLAVLGLDTYPFSDLIVLGFALLGGSLLGKTVWRPRLVFPAILLAASVFDILSFVSGPNSPSSGSPSQSGSATLLYINFTVRIGLGSRFILGSVDLFMLSAAVMVFALKGFTSWQVVVFGLASMLLPFVYLLILPTNGGLPLLPFIATTALVFWLISLGSGRRFGASRPFSPAPQVPADVEALTLHLHAEPQSLQLQAALQTPLRKDTRVFDGNTVNPFFKNSFLDPGAGITPQTPLADIIPPTAARRCLPSSVHCHFFQHFLQ